MKILIAPDKFKGSLSAKEVCQAIEKGLKKQDSEIEVISHPMADGGDGSLAVLGHYFNLQSITKSVCGCRETHSWITLAATIAPVGLLGLQR